MFNKCLLYSIIIEQEQPLEANIKNGKFIVDYGLKSS